MASKLQHPSVALVHQMPFTTDLSGFAATVEKIHFGCAMARFYPALNFLGFCCFTGMSYMFKKTLLDELKGLSWYGRYLAEDNFIASALQGYKLVLSAYPAQQNVTSVTVPVLKDRLVRWTRLRLNIVPVVAGLLEPLMETVPSGVIGGWTFHHLFGVNMYYFFPIHMSVMLFLGYIQLRTIQNGPPPFSMLMFVLCWVFRELLAMYIYIEALFKPQTITWGKAVFKVTLGGQATLVTDKPKD